MGKAGNGFLTIVGKKFGSLTVASFAGFDGKGKVVWRCICDCGDCYLVKASELQDENFEKCVCSYSKYYKTLYKRWSSMRRRCNNPNAQHYASYGGRGITVCAEWEDFETYGRWCLNSGFSKELELDRRDNDKGYSPENCRWVTRKVNSSNKRSNVWIEINGKRQIMSQWCEEYRIEYSLFRDRVKRGWNGTDLLLPAGGKRKNNLSKA